MAVTLKKEQHEAIYGHDGENLLVSASAGSGKTFVMINRMIRLILSGKLKVENMLAVTFTEKAASEMRERLSAAILKRLEEDGENADGLKAEMLALPTADICTIDAFCARLVKRYFFVLGIDRDFGVIEESLKERLTEEALDNVFNKLYKEKNADFLRFIDRFSEKRTDRSAKDLIVQLYYDSQNETNPSDYMGKTEKYYTEEGYAELVADLYSYTRKEFSKCINKLNAAKDELYEYGLNAYLDYVDEAVRVIGEFADEPDYFGYYGKKLELPRMPTVRTREGDVLDVVKKRFQKKKTNVVDKIKAIVDDVPNKEEAKQRFFATRGDYDVLRRLVDEFSVEFLRLKKEENAYDFCDIERFAYELLQDADVLAAVKSKYVNIFVDEYQDVNALQEDMFNILSSDNSFTVGDVKQSIYGFRGCDPDFFANKRVKMQKLGQTVDLNHNFRSSDGVVNAVNAIFDASMREDNCGLDYKNTSRLVAGGCYPDGDGSATLHIVNVPKKEKRGAAGVYDIVDDYNEKEATDDDYTALEIKRIIDEELKGKIFDASLGDYRKPTLSDIAVLCRRKIGSTVALTKSLAENGVKVVSEIETNACDFKEVKLLISFLKLLDCFYQDAPLSVCMISKIGGFSVAEISEISKEGRAIIRKRNEELCLNAKDKKTERYNISFSDCFEVLMNSDYSGADKLKEFYGYVRKIKLLAEFKGIRFALGKVIRDKGLATATITGGLGGKKQDKVERFLRESSVSGKELTVKEFLYKIENSPNSFTSSETAEGDAVTIMTLHKSKGLEFPIVIVVHAESAFSAKDLLKPVTSSKEYGVGLRYYDDIRRTYSDTLLRKAIKYSYKQRTVSEEARLFYVATTRAKYSLHIVALEKEEYALGANVYDVNRPLDFIPKGFNTEFIDGAELTAGTAFEPRKVLIGKKDEAACKLIKRNLDFKYPRESDVSLALKTSVTANLKGDDEGKPLFAEYTDGEAVETGFIGKNRPTAEEGVAAHKILELFDFDKLDDVDGEIGRIKASGAISDSEISSLDTDRMKKTLGLPIFNELKDAKLYREQYFISSVPVQDVFETESDETILLQGVIDLLAVKDGKAVIVDYKYSSKNAANLVKTYKKQLALYKKAVERSTDLKVVKTVIVSLLSSQAVEVEL